MASTLGKNGLNISCRVVCVVCTLCKVGVQLPGCGQYPGQDWVKYLLVLVSCVVWVLFVCSVRG